ncbi:MAG: nucleotide exchange factor GrpE, partial [Desulfobacterales bacterium]
MSEKKKIKIQSEPDEKEKGNDRENSDSDNNQPQNLEPEIAESESLEPTDPLKELKAKLAVQEQEAKEAHERLLRVSADYENYKKRSAREMEDFRKYANQSLLKEML